MINRNQFPAMTDAFDRRVRSTLDALPEQAQPRRARRPLRMVLAIGVAAALCVSGTAFAANAKSWFPMMFSGGGDIDLAGYVAEPEPQSAVVSNDSYQMEVDAFLYDKSAGAGIVSLHLTNRRGDGVMPFELSRTLPEFQGDGFIWSDFAECYAAKDGQLAFEVLYASSDPNFTDGFSGARFYLDESRSTANDYYIECAFIPGTDYVPGSALRLEALEAGKYQTDENGMERLASVLTLALPQPKAMPCLSSADGNITLSQIGLRIAMPGCTVTDDIDYIAVKLSGGSETVLKDEESNVDRMLYGYGGSLSEDSEYYDLATYVLGQSFALDQVSSIMLNGQEYPLTN